MRRTTAITLLALQTAILAIAVALLTTPAAAASPLTFVDGSAHFGRTHVGSSQPVVDDWTFSISAPSMGNASLVSAALGPVGTHWFQITDATLLGDDLAVAFEPVPMPNARWQAWFLPDSYLPAGDYTIRIEGNTYRGMGAGSYAGTVNVSPIPEPHTTALFAAGLAAVAWVARRKQPKD